MIIIINTNLNLQFHRTQEHNTTILFSIARELIIINYCGVDYLNITTISDPLLTDRYFKK